MTRYLPVRSSGALLATALLLASYASPSTASAAAISLTPGNQNRALSTGVLADGTSLLLVNAQPATAPSSATTYQLGWKDGATPCGSFALPGNTSQAVTNVRTARPSFQFYLKPVAVQYYDDATGAPIAPAPVPCTARVRVSTDTDAGEVDIPMAYATGELGLAKANAPATLVRQIVLPGDGISTMKLSVGGLTGSEIGQIPLSTSGPATGAILHATLSNDDRTGTLLSALGSATTRFAVGDSGRAEIIVKAPEVTGTNDLVMRLKVWAKHGDARTTEELLVRFLAPGYVAEAMLALPFEDAYSGFTLASRGIAPLDDSTAVPSAVRSEEGMTDYALKRSGGELLLYPAASSLNGQEGTISLWMRPADITAGATLLALTNADGTRLDAPMFELIYDDGTFSLRSGATTVATGQARLQAGTYAHVAATWSTAGAYIFVNGTRIAGSTNSSGMTNPAGKAISIGANGPGQGYIGLLDQVLIYARALRDTEVDRVYDLGPAGSLNTNPSMFSTVGFDAGGVLGVLSDTREPLDEHCDDPAESGGSATSSCGRFLSTRPQAPVRVTQCSVPDADAVGGRVLVSCATAGARRETDALYLADVGTQQFGGASATTIGEGYGTDVPYVPHASFAMGPFEPASRFASPMSTRFRLPPKDIPNLVVCNFPAVAGQAYNFADLDGYIFEDRCDNRYGGSGPLADRFKCVEPTGSASEQLARLNDLRRRYQFVLRDNQGDKMTQGWNFTFKPAGPDDAPYYFDLRSYEPLNDPEDVETDGTDTRQFARTPVLQIVDNANPGDGAGLLIDGNPVFTVDPVSSLFNFSLPSSYTRTAAMTVLRDASDPESVTSAGFSELKDVVIRFAAPGSSADTQTYFETKPFNIRYEVYPDAPSYMLDQDCSDTELTDAQRTACMEKRAMWLELQKPVD